MQVVTDGYTHHKQLEICGNPEDSGNGVQLNPALAGSSPKVTAVGDDTNVDLDLMPKGTGKFGYGTGIGGAVTQITSSSTGVTLNKPCGQITTVALTTAAAAEERFTVTNACVAATDVVVLSTTYNGAGTPAFAVAHVAAGAFDIIITNLHASAAFNAAMTINFVAIKAKAA